MPKLFDILDNLQPAKPSPEQVAAARWLDVATSIRQSILNGVEAIARDAATLGINPVLATMPPEVAKEFLALLPLIQTLWESATDAAKFPELPMDAPAVEPMVVETPAENI